MSNIEFLSKIDTIKQLVQKSSTGTPQELSTRLGISERTLYRLIKALRETGYSITYSRTRHSYILD